MKVKKIGVIDLIEITGEKFRKIVNVKRFY